MSRARYADSLIAKGVDIATAAHIAGVSEFWLRLRVDKSRVGTFVDTNRKKG